MTLALGTWEYSLCACHARLSSRHPSVLWGPTQDFHSQERESDRCDLRPESSPVMSLVMTGTQEPPGEATGLRTGGEQFLKGSDARHTKIAGSRESFGRVLSPCRSRHEDAVWILLGVSNH